MNGFKNKTLQENASNFVVDIFCVINFTDPRGQPVKVAGIKLQNYTTHPACSQRDQFLDYAFAVSGLLKEMTATNNFACDKALECPSERSLSVGDSVRKSRYPCNIYVLSHTDGLHMFHVDQKFGEQVAIITNGSSEPQSCPDTITAADIANNNWNKFGYIAIAYVARSHKQQLVSRDIGTTKEVLFKYSTIDIGNIYVASWKNVRSYSLPP
ncbi:hypothetical protein EDB19DRAFT_1835925 [Suillus lakei]|nr:hypothetical protein EDB19DRAFT_1835925 [Suillus lakei]